MITSSHNPKIQRVRGLMARHKDRVETQSFVVEGVRLLEEALAAGTQPELVLFTQQVNERGQKLLKQLTAAGCEVEEILPSLMDSISGTEAPQGILAVLPFINRILPQELDFVIIADGVRDPGNLGTLLRSAAAAGAQAVLLSPTCADVFAPKVVRAGMGAHFRVALAEMNWQEMREIVHSQTRPLKVFLAESGSGKPYWQADFRQPVALLIGGEAEGASPEGQSLADEAVTIPMPGGSESLNAAVAASILIFEIIRQRHA
jgi:TrmH family RNA methyltransferase